MTISVAITWILFLALFPITFFWMRRAWRIVFKRDFSEVALKRGEAPPNPEKYAPYAAAINLIGAGIIIFIVGWVVLYVAFGVGGTAPDYETWSAVAGSTIWCKFFADFILSRQAHPMMIKKRGKPASAAEKPGQ